MAEVWESYDKIKGDEARIMGIIAEKEKLAADVEIAVSEKYGMHKKMLQTSLPTCPSLMVVKDAMVLKIHSPLTCLKPFSII